MIDELQKEGLLIERSEVIDEFSRQIGGIVNAMGDRSDYEKRISAFHGWLKIKKEKHELSIKDDVESNILTLLQQGYLTIWACGSGGTNARMNATEEAQFKAQLAIDMNGSIETARRDSKLDAYVLDLDTLTYKTKYQDPKVGKLHAEFLEWEEQSRALTYSLANLVNTAPDEDFRASIAKIVMNLRRNDLRYAEELVTKNDPKNKLDLCKDLENVLMTIHWMTDNGKINGQIKANYLPRAEELNQKFLAKLNEQIFREIT
jgi:hypothetical protein